MGSRRTSEANLGGDILSCAACAWARLEGVRKLAYLTGHDSVCLRRAPAPVTRHVTAAMFQTPPIKSYSSAADLTKNLE